MVRIRYVNITIEIFERNRSCPLFIKNHVIDRIASVHALMPVYQVETMLCFTCRAQLCDLKELFSRPVLREVRPIHDIRLCDSTNVCKHSVVGSRISCNDTIREVYLDFITFQVWLEWCQFSQEQCLNRCDKRFFNLWDVS